MKYFIRNCFKFALSFFILTYSAVLLIKYTGFYKQYLIGNGIYRCIDKSNQKHNFNKLILGDSVGDQLFPADSSFRSFNSVACNKAIGIVGHYILLHNYLKAGNSIDSVFLVYNPESFINNLDEVYTFHYFLKPFYTRENKPLFSENVNVQIQKIPFYHLSRNPYVLTSNWSPDFELEDQKNYTFLSPISKEYLFKMKKLSEQYNFKFILIPAPVSDQKYDDIQKIDKTEIAETNLEREFEYYFNKLIFLNDSNFLPDGIHLKNPKKFIDHYYEIL